MMWDAGTASMVGGVGAVLSAGTIAGGVLRTKVRDGRGRDTVANLNQRVLCWWLICLLVGLALFSGKAGTAALFGVVSFLALREFLGVTPSAPADRWALAAAFYLVIPAQYFLVSEGWYGVLAVFVPACAFILLPVSAALAGESERFLERTAGLAWGLMACVYFVSYAPALLTLDVPGFEGRGENLVLYLVIVTELSDVFQYAWGKLVGRRRIAPRISPNKTWEGFVLGVTSATVVGTALWWATPFAPWQSLLMSLSITLMGFFGGLTMSAIKRDHGIKDFGNLLPGHGGVLDRIDSLAFAAPVFFHLTRYFFS